uniref:Uncharacterized protein n=1 Tax=Solanum tuberosum TaxID=4113 RepID=M1DG17_SOLTU
MYNKKHNKIIDEVYNEVAICRNDHPNLLDDFTIFLPDSSIFVALLLQSLFEDECSQGGDNVTPRMQEDQIAENQKLGAANVATYGP